MKEKMYLYKYKPLKTVEEIGHLEDILQQKIWIPTAEDMNDPFEFVHKFKSDPAKEFQDPSNLNNSLASYNQCAKERNQPELTIEQFVEMLKNPDFIQQNEANPPSLKKIKENYKKVGVFCLTTDYSNIPMWAHYGNEHKGYCLIFELDFSALPSQNRMCYQQAIIDGSEIVSFSANHDKNLKFAFGKVTYSDTPETIDYHDALEILKGSESYDQMKFWFDKVFGVKYKQWSYECEYRLISSTSSKNSDRVCLNLSYHVPFLKVCGVIMGKYFPVKETTQALCSKYEIDLYQSDTSEQEYAITLKKIMDFKKTPVMLPENNGCEAHNQNSAGIL